MASFEELLVDTLKELGEADLNMFQWHLQKDHECISKSEMENTDRLKTVDKMVACFGPKEAVKIAVCILKKMKQNHLGDELANKYKQAQDQGNMKTSAPVAADSNMGTMAEARILVCPVCQDLLKDPVTIQCGHCCCKSCIKGCRNQEDQMRVCSCPQCRETFSPRLASARYTMLVELEKMKTKLPADCYAGAQDVQCDICTGRKYKAVKFCSHQLKEMKKPLQQRIQQREKDLQQLREAVESHKRSAQTAVEDSERIFTELISSIERSRSEIVQWIRDQEKAAVSQAEGRLKRLEQEINDLRRRDAELEQLSHTQDHIHFLQSFQCLSAPPESTDTSNISFISPYSFDGMRESVYQLRDKLEDFCKEVLKKISDRDDYQLTLDPNTVNKYLRLSENNRAIIYTNTDQPYPDHPDRFDKYLQVLCRESVSGHCYWEIEWSGDNGVCISVSYKSISRKGVGDECWFGRNDQSWSLFCSPSRYSFRHNNTETVLPVKSISSRVGVYVDFSAGTLSFFSVSDTMSLIHTQHTTFTQPLYPGFWVGFESSVKLC